jgi:hypothetical protein
MPENENYEAAKQDFLILWSEFASAHKALLYTIMRTEDVNTISMIQALAQDETLPKAVRQLFLHKIRQLALMKMVVESIQQEALIPEN